MLYAPQLYDSENEGKLAQNQNCFRFFFPLGILNNILFILEIPVTYESLITISCDGDALPSATATWITPDTANFQQIGNSLVFRSFDITDEGMYVCSLGNGIEPNATRYVQLIGIANTSNSAPKVFKPNAKYIDVYESDNVTLTCRCTMCPQINQAMFHKLNGNDTKSPDVMPQQMPNRFGLQRKFENISANDSGSYHCVLENSNGMDEFTIELNVKRLPNVEQSKDLHQCNVNKDVIAIHLETLTTNLTIPSKAYKCISSDVQSTSITVLLLGKLSFWDCVLVRFRFRIDHKFSFENNKIHISRFRAKFNRKNSHDYDHIK